jgi:hypothetical protein
MNDTITHEYTPGTFIAIAITIIISATVPKANVALVISELARSINFVGGMPEKVGLNSDGDYLVDVVIHEADVFKYALAIKNAPNVKAGRIIDTWVEQEEGQPYDGDYDTI